MLKAVFLLLLPPLTSPAATLYWKTSSANLWTGSFWGTTSGGSTFTSAWVSGSDVVFEANGGTTLTITGATTSVASITANENVNVTSGGTLNTGGTVASIDVASGKTLTFAGQALSTAGGTRFIKNGLGTWSLTGSAYTGGLTLNAGTILASGVNALGSGGALTINGGKISSTSASARDFTGRHNSITIGGDFILGDVANTGALTFSGPMALGTASRTITVVSAATFNSIISSGVGGGIIKQGAALLTLGGANNYSGTTTLRGGTLRLAHAANASVLSDSAALILAHGTLDLAGTVAHEEIVLSTTINGGAHLTRSTGTSTIRLNAITRTTPGTLNLGTAGIASTDTLNDSSGILGAWATVGGANYAINSTNSSDGAITALTSYTDISRLGGVIQESSGAQVQIINGGASGDVTLAGVTTTDINTLKMGATDGPAIVTITSGQSLRFGPNGGVLAAAGAGALRIGTSAGSGIITAGGAADTAGDLYLTNYSANVLTVNSVITNNGTGVVRVVISGTGTTAFAADNTFTGGLVMNSGILSVNNPGRLGAATSSVTFAGDSTLQLNGWATLASASTRSFQINAGVTATIEAVTQSGFYELQGVITGDGTLVKTGGGSVTLNVTAKSFTGGLHILGGSIRVALDNRLGAAPASATPANIYINGGRLVVFDNDLTINSNRGIALGAGNTATGTGVLVNSGLTATYGGVMADYAGVAGTLFKDGLGVLHLTNANTYSGAGTVDAGILRISHASALGTTAGITTVNDAAALELSFASDTTIAEDITFTGTGLGGLGAVRNVSGNNTLSGLLRVGTANTSTSPRLIVADAGTTLTLSGTIRTGATADGTRTLFLGGSGNILVSGVITNGTPTTRVTAFTKQDGGTVTLSNANTYSGATNINGGTLLVTNTTGSATGTGSLTTAVGTILGGTGTIAPTGTNSVSIGGSVAPGVSGAAGTLRFTPVDGSVTFQSAGGVAFELFGNGSNDKIVFNAAGSGVIDLSALAAGSLGVTFAAGYTPVLGHSFDLLDWAAVSGSGISGLSASLLNASTAGFDPSWIWDTSAFVSDGVITIALVPEPARSFCLATGIMALHLRRRR